jgi:hypothetical protein
MRYSTKRQQYLVDQGYTYKARFLKKHDIRLDWIGWLIDWLVGWLIDVRMCHGD